ncbi:MAG: hypothetical protein H0W25_05140 [Acidimicrobiia bacterium]|nr:hypothetical protein [Acidimicrobiia bacterium]
MRNRTALRALTTAVLVAGLPLTGCGDDGSPITAPGFPVPDAAGDGQGTIRVHLEETEGIFVEGFEIGLRFEGADGTELKRVLWSDFVASTGDQSMEAFHDSVLEQVVPAGTVTVGADVRMSIGGPIEPPDLDAESLPCETEVPVPAGGTVEVEVSFSGEADCVTVAE